MRIIHRLGLVLLLACVNAHAAPLVEFNIRSARGGNNEKTGHEPKPRL